ncbi:unnamed protein product [Clonostachys solani]|uniref:Uncharacterized protein n=1 Tax=Clonostachys solani TaxID=160281 RepID=A0A9P0EJA2_9HYPO|nr:unnamed protein product [Clonostachys solani]
MRGCQGEEASPRVRWGGSAAIALELERGYDTVSFVVPAGRLDAGKGPDGAVHTIGAHQQARSEGLAARELDNGPFAQVHVLRLLAIIDALNLGVIECVDPTELLEPLEKTRCDVQVLNHVSDVLGRRASLPVKFDTCSSNTIPHLHFLVLLDTAPLHVRPCAYRVEELGRGWCEGAAAVGELGWRQREGGRLRKVLGLDEGDTETRCDWVGAYGEESA